MVRDLYINVLPVAQSLTGRPSLDAATHGAFEF